MDRRLINKKDILIIFAMIFIAITFRFGYNYFYGNNSNIKAVITLDGQIIKEITLDDDTIFFLPEKENVIFEIRDKKIRFKHSDCPDLICVKSGFLSLPGQMASCLPNRLTVKITGAQEASENEPDMVIGIRNNE